MGEEVSNGFLSFNEVSDRISRTSAVPPLFERLMQSRGWRSSVNFANCNCRQGAIHGMHVRKLLHTVYASDDGCVFCIYVDFASAFLHYVLWSLNGNWMRRTRC